ncbi:Protein phosphatase methylesterase 1 [Batrachochytrium dendrobatidis]
MNDCFSTIHDVDLPDQKARFKVYEIRNSNGPVYVLHHGAGHTAMTWYKLAQNLKNLTTASTSTECSILCYDARAHGSTASESEDIPLNVLSNDLAAIINHCYPQPHKRDIILVGHSLGGSVVVDAMSRSLVQGVRGVVVLDVVEGTAIDSLIHMKRILQARPSMFNSEDEAIQWAAKNNHVKNIELARLTIIDQLIKIPSGKLIWRTDLQKTSHHWKDWFDNLSEKFLAVRAGRLLVLAEADRLDKPLTIGQMQGKFQMEIYLESGHNIQEDAPDRLARDLHEFWKRNQSLVTIKRFPIPPLKSSVQHSS